MAQHKSDTPIVVDGIKINATQDDAQDYEIVELLAASMDESLSDEERGAAVTVSLAKIPKLLFGSDWARIKGELRDKHDGKLTNEVVQDFITKTFEALNRKNS